MKKWVVVAALGLGACQSSTPPTVSQEQAVLEDCYGVGNFCNATMPQTSSWKPGQPLPPMTSTSVVVTQLVSTKRWEAYGADPVAGQIRWAVGINPADFGAFMILVAGKDHPFGGVRPPGGDGCPPNCVDPEMILAVALRTLDVRGQAQLDAAACDLP
ncbi:MAG: hypothetical protein H7138_14145 [Myxococcales bacterium]|nr:hypothetical protein [Myxococcales bacterium]